MNKTFFLIAVVVVLVGAAATGTYLILQNQAMQVKLSEPCGTAKVAEASQKISEVVSRWGDAHSIAGSTATSALSGSITNMQSLKRELEAIEVPDCMKNIITNYSQGMEDEIKGWMSCMAYDAEPVINQLFTSAGQNLERGNEAMDQVAACAPDCP